MYQHCYTQSTAAAASAARRFNIGILSIIVSTLILTHRIEEIIFGEGQTEGPEAVFIIMDTSTTASAHTHMGTPPPGYDEEWVTHTIHCHGFASLTAEDGEFVDSPEFMLLGNPWRLQIYPQGDASAADGMASIYLWNKSDKAIEIHYGVSINNGNGQVAYKRSTSPRNFHPVGVVSSGRGWPDFAERTTLLSSLVNGTLIIEVHMRLPNLTKSNLQPFIPENPSTCKTIQDSFMEEKYSDVAFEVGGEKGKVTEATSVTFPAHRMIVAKFSNTLADLCASGAGDNVTTRIPIEIDNVSPDIFRLLLSYIYGMTISNDNMKLHAKEIIDAADRFGVTSLKLEAEASLVNNTAFDIQNVKEPFSTPILRIVLT